MSSGRALGITCMLIGTLLLPACQSPDNQKNENNTSGNRPGNDPPSGELIFHTGFEPSSTVINQTSSGADITGTDASVDPPNDWVSDLEGHPRIGDFRIQYQGGDSSQRMAEIIPDPTIPGNHVFRYRMHRPNVDTDAAYGGKFRIQTNLYGNHQFHEVYYRYRLYLTGDWQILMDREAEMDWFILGEYWNNGGWTGEDHVFRMHLTISKDRGPGNPLYLGLSGQTKPDGWKTYWHEENKEFHLPLEEWLNVEILIREGDREAGRFWVRVTRASGETQVVFDVRNHTRHPADPAPDGFRHLNPLKGYSHRDNINFVTDAGGTLQILWDDFALYDGLASAPD